MFRIFGEGVAVSIAEREAAMAVVEQDRHNAGIQQRTNDQVHGVVAVHVASH
jgi:hypothetical protein